jgi:predicted  nucleic acid-binding Zn-ribbon protein
METQPFKAFIDLITFDQKLQKLHKEIVAAQVVAAELERKKQDRARRAEQIHAQGRELRKQVDAQELEMKSLDAQEKAKRAQLDTVRDIRAYESLEKEVNHLKHAQHESEKSLLGLWNRVEATQKEFERVQQQDAVELATLSQQHADVLAKIEALQTEFNAIEHDRPAKKEFIPEEWLEQYESMRSRIEDPVVPEEDGTCSGCFATVNGQDMLRLRHKALLTCKSCYRLLYQPKAMGINLEPEASKP